MGKVAAAFPCVYTSLVLPLFQQNMSRDLVLKVSVCLNQCLFFALWPKCRLGVKSTRLWNQSPEFASQLPFQMCDPYFLYEIEFCLVWLFRKQRDGECQFSKGRKGHYEPVFWSYSFLIRVLPVFLNSRSVKNYQSYWSVCFLERDLLMCFKNSAKHIYCKKFGKYGIV